MSFKSLSPGICFLKGKRWHWTVSSLRTSSALFLYGFWSSDLFWTLVFLPGLPPAVRSAIKSWNNKVGIESPGTERWGKVCHYEIYILGGDGVAWGLGSKQTTKRRACLPAKSRQSWPTLCYPMDCSAPGSSAHGILQARILEWVAIPFSRGFSWPSGWTWVSCTAGEFLLS